MIRYALVLGILAAGVASAASPGMPSGNYAGTATWRGAAGSSGTYAVETAIHGSTITTRYAWTDPKPRSETMTVTLAIKGTDPVFDVLDEAGKVIGKGYCYDQVCGYHIAYGSITLDETYRWSGSNLEVVGGKSGPGFSVAWREALTAK
jgi:hypothetical protein